MNRTRSRYTYLGLALVAGGGALAFLMWLVVGYLPLVALGIGAVILGVVSLGLSRTLPQVSLDAGQVLLEAGMDNIAALVEELGLRSRAIYLPSSRTRGVSRALIPMNGSIPAPALRRELGQRLLVPLGEGPEDFGLLVATPGSAALARLGAPPPASSPAGLEGTLSAILAGRLDLVDGVRVSPGEDTVLVELIRPALGVSSHPAFPVLGSPLASIAAAIVADALDRPVSIVSEAVRGGRLAVTLGLHGQVAP